MIVRTILIITAIVVALVAIALWFWAAYSSCIKVCRTDNDKVVARFRTAWEAECYLDDRLDEGLYIQY